MVVGITGGLASGKSTVTRGLRDRGAITFSADEAARAVLTPGGAVSRQIAAELGTGLVNADGSVDRAALGRLIFSNADARHRLNAIMHPAILRLLRAQIDSAREDLPPDTHIVVEVPLLFEANLSGWFERIVVVSASEPTQIVRLAARNGLTQTEAGERLKTQWPIAEKARRADFLILNDGSLDDLDMAVDRLWSDLKQNTPAGARNR